MGKKIPIAYGFGTAVYLFFYMVDVGTDSSAICLIIREKMLTEGAAYSMTTGKASDVQTLQRSTVTSESHHLAVVFRDATRSGRDRTPRAWVYPAFL